MDDAVRTHPLIAVRYDLRATDFGPSHAELFAAMLDQVSYADRNGIDRVHVSEHHHAVDGYLPSVFPALAAIAARTSRVRIRPSALILALHDPVRVAEDAAVVDNISGGRLDLTVGAGYREVEFRMLGRDFANRGTRLRHAVRFLRRAWTGEPCSFEDRPVLVLRQERFGTFLGGPDARWRRWRKARVQPGTRTFSQPQPSSGRLDPPINAPTFLDRALVRPVPARPGGPPIIMGGSTPKTARRAAEIADGYDPASPSLMASYQAACAELGKKPGEHLTRVGPFFLHVADDPERMRHLLAPHVWHELRQYASWNADSDHLRATPDIPLESVWQRGSHQVLTPDEAVDLVRGFPPNSLLTLNPLCGGLPPALADESPRLFVEKVLPAVRG